MVTIEMKWVLTHTKVDPLVVASIWGVNEDECWEYISLLNRRLNEIENKRATDGINERARAFAESLINANDYATRKDVYETRRLLLLERLKNSNSEKEKQERLEHYKIFMGKKIRLPESLIEQARAFPLKDLLGTSKSITNCPFHDDRTASLNIKNNFFYCHGCGISGDSISFVMKRDGVTFKEAVIKLT